MPFVLAVCFMLLLSAPARTATVDVLQPDPEKVLYVTVMAGAMPWPKGMPMDLVEDRKRIVLASLQARPIRGASARPVPPRFHQVIGTINFEPVHAFSVPGPAVAVGGGRPLLEETVIYKVSTPSALFGLLSVLVLPLLQRRHRPGARRYARFDSTGLSRTAPC